MKPAGVSTDRSFAGTVRRAVGPLDVAALCAVPVLLLVVFRLPVATREALLFSYRDPTLATAFAAPFVHLGIAHLLTNLVGYLLVVPTAYLLCALSGHRRRFYVAFVTFLFVFPPVLSYLNLAIARPGLALGFSGVNLAFLGFFPVAIAGHLRARFDLEAPLDVAGSLFFVVLALVAVLSYRSMLTYGLAAAALLSAVLYAASAAEACGRIRPNVRAAARTAGHFELAAVGLLLFVLFTFVAFPTDPVVDDGVVNLYVHLVGYALGFTATYVTLHAERRLPAAVAAGVDGTRPSGSGETTRYPDDRTS